MSGVVALVLVSILLNGCRQDFLEKGGNVPDLSDVELVADAAIVETGFFKANQDLGGDVKIISAKIEGREAQVQKNFYR